MKHKPSLIVIFMTVFIDLIGFGIVMPLLPLYSQKFGANGFTIGLIIASFSVMQFVFSPIWGRLSDRIGRRPVLLISLAAGAVSYAMFAVASTLSGSLGLWLILASRTFAGICGGNITVAQAYIADISPPEHRSARMGLIGMAFGLGFIFGPAIGATSAKYGLAAPGWVATVLCGLNFLAAYFVLPESWKPNAASITRESSSRDWSKVLSQPRIGLLIILFFAATFCFACYETTLALLAHKQFRLDEAHVGYLFAYSGVISSLVQGGMIKRLVQKCGEPMLICSSFVLLGLSLIILPYVNTMSALLFALALLSLGTSINRPPIFGLVSMLTPAHEQGATLGIAQSAGSLARIIGPVFAAALFDVNLALPYVSCGIIALIAAVLTWQGLGLSRIRPPSSDSSPNMASSSPPCAPGNSHQKHGEQSS